MHNRVSILWWRNTVEQSLHCYRDTWTRVSHVFVHEDITWDHIVLWQDVFAHVNYPLSLGYAHAALSARVSLLHWEQTATCTVQSWEARLSYDENGWTQPEARVPKQKMLLATTLPNRTSFHLTTEKDKHFVMYKVFGVYVECIPWYTAQVTAMKQSAIIKHRRLLLGGAAVPHRRGLLEKDSSWSQVSKVISPTASRLPWREIPDKTPDWLHNVPPVPAAQDQTVFV